jgi:FKBP-type peptidyl-prolyl cis-trans isomerase
MNTKSMIVRVNWITVLGVFLLWASAVSAGDAAFKDQKEKISYGIGVGVARDFKLRGVELDVDAFLKGLRDELSGSKLLMTEKDLDATMDGYTRELRLKQEQAEKTAAEENRKAGQAFLAANAKKKDVVTLPSGLQYRVLKAGKGDKPVETDAVQINYRGTLIDGTEIDSSYRKAEPSVVKVNGVVPGLREAFKLMSPGSKWEIFIPSELAYGDRKVYQIGPNAALIFEVELLSVLKGAESKEATDGKASK